MAVVRGMPRGAWERTTIQDRLLILSAFALGGAVTSVLGLAIFGPPIVDFLGANIPLVRFFIAATVILLITVPTAFLITYLELKVIARMNLRAVSYTHLRAHETRHDLV